MIPPGIPRAALVTGGSRRLGRAIALALAEQGIAIAIHHNQSDPTSTVAEIRALGVPVVTLRADLAREAEVETLLPAAMQALGPIGILINNASTFERDSYDNVTRASWDAHIEPNLRAPFLLTQAFAKSLPPANEGCILNLLDERVWSLTPHFVSYTISKSALWTLTRTMALALAPRIRVNGIGPGPALPSIHQTDAQYARQAASVPLGHGTTPEEVARIAIALISFTSVTGQMIAPDGGQHLQWGASRVSED